MADGCVICGVWAKGREGLRRAATKEERLAALGKTALRLPPAAMGWQTRPSSRRRIGAESLFDTTSFQCSSADAVASIKYLVEVVDLSAGFHGIAHKHGNGHGTDPTRDRSDRSAFWRNRGEVHIADQSVSAR